MFLMMMKTKLSGINMSMPEKMKFVLSILWSRARLQFKNTKAMAICLQGCHQNQEKQEFLALSWRKPDICNAEIIIVAQPRCFLNNITVNLNHGNLESLLKGWVFNKAVFLTLDICAGRLKAAIKKRQENWKKKKNNPKHKPCPLCRVRRLPREARERKWRVM